MGRIGLDSTISDAEKSRLVLEICSTATALNACSHKHHFNNPVNSHFIDWYRLLGVDEDSGLELIKRRYYKLALQLHPDKNKHPKAEVAFKLVSEAYACLSDSTRRKAFNMERWKYFCIQCNEIPFSTANHLPNSQQHSSKLKSQDPKNNSRSGSGRVMQRLQNMRDRFKEEIRVIENCLRVNSSLSRKETPVFNPSNSVYQSKIKAKNVRETPIFEPSDYGLHGYPHLRDQIYKKPVKFWELERGRLEEKRKYHSPTFQNESANIMGIMLRSKSVCIHS